MRIPVLFGLLLLGGTIVAGGQAPADARLDAKLDIKLVGQLKRVFPSASTFSPKSGAPPHFKAYANDALLGFVFWTTELEPLERGYDGPIKILVGLNLNGTLTGIIVTDHHEPYGYFSVATPGFAAQFAGKAISDPFKVGADIDAVSRASISVGSASRAVRNSARRIARQLLTPDGAK
jgi:transcriptional regulator of nitric oxide reductase